MDELKNICIEIKDGDWIESKDQSKDGIRLVQTGNIGERIYIEKEDKSKFISEETFKSLKCTEIFEGDVLISRLPSPVGRACVFPKTSNRAITAVDCTIVRLNKSICNPKYFVYYTSYDMYARQIEKFLTGTTRLRISRKNLETIKVPLPKVEVQEKIVKILDKAQELIDKRKVQIEALDVLVKSKFIEMFGDPVSNPKQWDKVNIGERFEIKTGATPSRSENLYWENGTIPWVKTTELKEFVINKTEEYITEDGYNNSSVNMLPKDTVLIAMYGQGKTRGMTGKLGIDATTNQACAGILPNDKENMDFIWYQLRLLYKDLRELGRGGNQPNLNTNLIKTFKLIFPPMEIQNQFTDFIKQVDKLKFEMQESLTQLEDNFNSLMKRAFKEELFN